MEILKKPKSDLVKEAFELPSSKQQIDVNQLVLIVETHEVTLTMLKLWLEIWNYRTAESSSYEEVFDLVDELKPDIILLDITSNNLNKFDYIQKLQNVPVLENIPFVFVSSYLTFSSFPIKHHEQKFDVLPIDFSSLEKVFKKDSRSGELVL